jgi:hypothetical protein
MRQFLLCALLALSQAASAANTLTAEEAKNHIGETATVCGVVASTHYATQTKGSPTFVNIDKPYPNEPFTILIWGEDLQKFSPKPITWDGKRVCANRHNHVIPGKAGDRGQGTRTDHR